MRLGKDDSARPRGIAWARVSIICWTIVLLMELLEPLIFGEAWTTRRMIKVAGLAAILFGQFVFRAMLRGSTSSER